MITEASKYMITFQHFRNNQQYVLNLKDVAAHTEGSMNNKLRVATWNVAAINNNPFEYFVEHDDPAYFELLRRVEELIDAPGEKDVTLGTLIDEEIFADLCRELEMAKLAHVDAARGLWKRELRDRRFVLSLCSRPIRCAVFL